MADPTAEDRALAEAGAALADAVEAALPGWVVGSVRRLLAAWSGADDPDPAVLARAEDAGRQAVEDVVPRLRRLLAADVDAQRTGPLALLREAVDHPAAVLREAGVPEVRRDAFDEAALPDDVYDLAPRSFADVDPSLLEVGVRWGATKARASMVRHKPGGRPGAGASEGSGAVLRADPAAPRPDRRTEGDPGGAAGGRVVALVPDLMDRSRVSAAVPAAGFVPRAEALAEAGLGPGDVALVDLARPGALDALAAVAAAGARVVAFGAHVERDLLAEARARAGPGAAGAVEVLPRSAFFRDLAALVAKSRE